MPIAWAQGQVEQALNRQAELDRRLAVLRTPAPLAAGTAVPVHVLVQPDEQVATRLQRRVVVFPIGRSVLRFCSGTHADSLPCAHARPLHRPICATKPYRAAVFSLLEDSDDLAVGKAGRLYESFLFLSRKFYI